jgi:hypothetical protein
MRTYIIIYDDRIMSEFAEEVVFNYEEETILQSPTPVPESPNSPRRVIDISVEETNLSREEDDNVVVPVSNITSAAANTNVFTITTPTITLPSTSREGLSRLSEPLTPGVRVLTSPALNRPLSRHPRPTHPEPPTQRSRLIGNLNDMPRVLAGWRSDERLLNSDEFGVVNGPTIIPALTMEPIHNTVPTLVLRMIRAERRTAELRDRTNILRKRVENQDSLIVKLESEVEEDQFKIHGLEETVLDMQEKIARFEAMFEAISRAAAITSLSPSQ